MEATPSKLACAVFLSPIIQEESRLPRYFFRWRIFPGLLLLLVLTGCAYSDASPAARTATQTGENTSSATATARANNTSTASFTLSGGKTASYTLRTSAPASELRHGHREFTILLKDAGVSLFIVFYGYQGPGNYTLMDSVNGGDVHIGLEQDTISWDLMMQPTERCELHVTSDIPTRSPGLDRMRGSFTCPRLPSSSPAHPQQPVTVNNGSFDIAMLVTS